MKEEQAARIRDVATVVAAEMRLRVTRADDRFVRVVDTLTAETPYVHYWRERVDQYDDDPESAAALHVAIREELRDVARRMRGIALLELLTSDFALEELDDGQLAQLKSGMERLAPIAGVTFDGYVSERIAAWVQRAGRASHGSDEDDALRMAIGDGIRSGMWKPQSAEKRYRIDSARRSAREFIASPRGFLDQKDGIEELLDASHLLLEMTEVS